MVWERVWERVWECGSVRHSHFYINLLFLHVLECVFFSAFLFIYIYFFNCRGLHAARQGRYSFFSHSFIPYYSFSLSFFLTIKQSVTSIRNCNFFIYFFAPTIFIYLFI